MKSSCAWKFLMTTGWDGLETPARRRPQVSRQGRRSDDALLPPETGSEFHVISSLRRQRGARLRRPPVPCRLEQQATSGGRDGTGPL